MRDPAALGRRAPVEDVLDEDAVAHVARHVEAEPGEIVPAQLHRYVLRLLNIGSVGKFK